MEPRSRFKDDLQRTVSKEDPAHLLLFEEREVTLETSTSKRLRSLDSAKDKMPSENGRTAASTYHAYVM